MKRQIGWSAAVLAAGLLAGGTIFPAGTGYAAIEKKVVSNSSSNIVTLKLNGVNKQQQGLFVEGHTYVPVTFLRDVLKMPVSYDSSSKTYSVGKDYRQLNLSVYSEGIAADLNGFYLNDAEAKMVDGRLFVPFQWVKNYLGYQGEWSAATKRLNVMPSKENGITLTSVTSNEDSSEAKINLKYPQVSNVSNTEAESAINEILKKDALTFKESIEKQIQERITVQEIGLQSQPYEFMSAYIVTYNQNNVLSLITENYEYTGGAHGMTYRKGYTFSLKDGKLLGLGDLFGKNANYEKQLNDKIKAKLNATPGYFGGFEKLGEHPDFYLQQGTLKMFFQLYEYTPYAAGFPELSFSFDSLLPKDSPFESLK
ncbi:Copper amine oxidase N-terminal domain-containing protein [Fontibacillus panacisegetis]|uniref:Copper amine oxidase N-terminal domain-containing protein n=1 Tax=Fontibacillus panacisegetis TaxID=670482 RepID=A0A1G7S1H7_9BACL|nr:DUF4163 domain-containing protein [Fontibacillus panacisegetis]SDG15950.1 Copper amine oxidase N-terminal domain-containing protein [Fontibacillus panacisegetis]